MAPRGRSSLQDTSSTLQGSFHQAEQYNTDVRCTSCMCAGPSPHCNLTLAWPAEVESKQVEAPEMGSYWYAKGKSIALCTIWKDRIKYFIRKGSCILQHLHALTGTLIGVVG